MLNLETAKTFFGDKSLAGNSDLFKNKVYHNGFSPSSRYTSLSTADFRWLIPEAWDQDALEFYVKLRNTLRGNFFKLPSTCSNKKKTPPQLAAAWILTDNEGQRLAIAELQSYKGALETQYLNVVPASKHADARFISSLGFLISALFITSQPDILNLTSNHLALLETIDSFKWGPTKTLYEPNLGENAASSPFTPHLVVSLWQEEWWRSELGSKYKKQLQYLSLRKQKQDKAEYAQSCEARRKRRRSLLQRLLQPRIEF